jgi:hypothetical protein
VLCERIHLCPHRLDARKSASNRQKFWVPHKTMNQSTLLP